jgi:hypothetical protein
MATEIIVNEIDGNAVQTVAQGSRESVAEEYPAGCSIRLAVESVQPGESQIVEFEDDCGEMHTVKIVAK